MRSSDGTHVEDLADLYDNAPCGYISLSPDGDIVLANKTLADWLGYSTQDLLSRSIHDILSVGGKIAFETNLAPILRLRGKVHEVAIDLVTAERQSIPCIANASEKRDEAGKHLFTRLTIFQAVDRRSFERGLLADKVKAEDQARQDAERLKARDQFIAVLGHDLRNPLAAVRSGINMLQRSDPAPERKTIILSEISKALDRSSKLIDDVMDFARGQLGSGIPVYRKPHDDLAATLQQIVDEIQIANPERKIEHSIVIDLTVHCDPARIAQLGSNLLANALTHGSSDEPIFFRADATETRFSLSVENSGEEIAEKTQKRLFLPFVKGEKGNAKSGLGLGLFIVNQIAEAHGGNMEASSDAERTRFTFTMPMDQSDNA